MIRIIGLAIGAALVLGTATASFAESPYGAQAISPSVPPQGGVRDETPPPDALTGSPQARARAQPAGWTWTTQRLGRRVVRVVPQR
jgi:hypothetical protein